MNPKEAELANEIAPVATYHEKKIGRTIYRVTNVHRGEINLAKTLEDLIVRKILAAENLSLSRGR